MIEKLQYAVNMLIKEVNGTPEQTNLIQNWMKKYVVCAVAEYGFPKDLADPPFCTRQSFAEHQNVNELTKNLVKDKLAATYIEEDELIVKYRTQVILFRGMA